MLSYCTIFYSFLNCLKFNIISYCCFTVPLHLTNFSLSSGFKFFRGTLKDKPKDEVNKYVFDIINFIEKERLVNESLYIKCIKKKEFDYSFEK